MAACSRPTPSSSAACSTPSNAARPGRASTRAARERAIQAGGVYSLTAQLSKLPAFCPVWRVPVAPAAERQPVTAADPDAADERRLRLADAAELGPRRRARTCPNRATWSSAPRATACRARIRARRACATNSSTRPIRAGRCPAVPTRRPTSPARRSGSRHCRRVRETGKNEPSSRPYRRRIPDHPGADGLHRPQPARLGGVQRRRPRHHRDLERRGRCLHGRDRPHARAHRQAVRRQPAAAVHPRSAGGRAGRPSRA